MNSIIALSLFGIINLFLGFLKNRKILLPATLIFGAIALFLNVADWNQELVWFNGMLHTDNASINFTSIILVSMLLVMGISRSFGEDDEHTHPAEYYSIMLFSVVGAIMMTNFENMIMLFIGLEILSVSMYVLTGSDKRSLRSNEAALKYFLMGAFATGILLFGIALIYGATGSFNIHAIAGFMAHSHLYSFSSMLYIGVFMVIIGMLFKVSAAPFHFWTPDVYEGAPTLFTAFMSTIVKTAGFAAIYRLLLFSMGDVWGMWANAVNIIAMTTLIIGNITAVYQLSFKRMMAYSSISHAGYMLAAIVANEKDSQSAILFYSLAYSIATITAFAVLMLVSEAKLKDGKPNESFDAFNGLAKNNPLLAFSLAVSMLSLAGIPLTAGFWGKFFIFSNAMERGSGMIILLVIAILMSAVGIYYYFRAVIASYMKEGDVAKIEIPTLYKIILILTTTFTIVLGIFPDLVKHIF